MRVVYLMAMKNVEHGKLHEILAPIVSGELSISGNAVNVRLLAIWAIEKSLEAVDYRNAHDLLWPVMADLALPVKLRIAAYEILINQASTMTDVLHMYWFMVYERNEHLYNYHHTTIKGIANSVDPCKLQLRELVRKIMRFTRVHDHAQQYHLSWAQSFDYKDEKYNHAQKLRASVVRNEVTGVPEVIEIEHVVTEGRSPVSNFVARLHLEGCDELLSTLSYVSFSNGEDGIVDSDISKLLKHVSKGVISSSTPMNVYLVLSWRGRVILANHYNDQSIDNAMRDVFKIIQRSRSTGPFVNTMNDQRITYARLYEKQVTSEMGLPVVFENRVPSLSSFRISADGDHIDQSMLLEVSIEAKVWRHGDYSISVYNPFADVWHSVRRTTEFDLSLPFRATILYNPEKNSVRLTLPRQPTTPASIAGILSHAKDCVTVNEDDENTLNDFCPTCHPVENVSPPNAMKKKFQTTYDSIDTGLQYSMAIFDCENGVTPVTLKQDWFRAFASNRKNYWNDWLAHGLMATHQAWKNMIISPKMGTCGNLIKILPSVVHSTSHVNITLRMNYEDVDKKLSTYHVLPSEKYSLIGKMDVVAASTNEISRSWDLNVNADLNPEHSDNRLKVSLTRRVPEETNYKICLEGQKYYSEPPADPLQLGSLNDRTVSKLSIAAGPTDAEECTRDHTLIRISLEGGLSEEQKDKYNEESSKSPCSNDIKNPLYSNPKNLVPKTLNCIEEAIRYTTLRNYKIAMDLHKVPDKVTSKLHYFGDLIRSYLLPNLEYTGTSMMVPMGGIRAEVTYPLEKEEVNIQVAAPEDRLYDFIDVKLEEERFNGFGPVFWAPWSFPLDNTRFSLGSLIAYADNDLKFCSVYPKTVMTGDGKNVAYEMSDEWILVSGDQVDKNFAILVKKIGKNVGLKILVGNHSLEMTPDAADQVRVTVDGQVLENLENGVVVPSGETEKWIFKITKNGDHIVTRINGIPILTTHGINHVALAIGVELQGRVSGLCGQLNGTPARKLTKTSQTDL